MSKDGIRIDPLEIEVILALLAPAAEFLETNVADINVVLGVQWLYYLWEHTMNYQVPE